MPPFLESFGQQYGAGPAWILASLFIFLRYAIPASLVFWVVYQLKRTDWLHWKIQQKFPKSAQIRTEITNSLLTSFVFGGMAIGIYALRKMGYGAMYFDISAHGWGYYFFTIIAMIFAHDAYFYWTHRLMHHPRLFRLVHLVHHRSVNTTPYTSFSFHPLESLVEFGIVPLIALVLPIHVSALFIFTVFSIVFNIMGHTGYEFSPSGFTTHWLFKWINTPTHHNMHHEKANFNYGLYFNIWDRIMGTNHPDYEHTFEQVKHRTTQQLQAAQPTAQSVVNFGSVDFVHKNTATPPSCDAKKLATLSIKSTVTLLLLLLFSTAYGQVSLEGIKNGQYGTPESRAKQADEMMLNGLGLRKDQIEPIKAINLKYAYRIEQEVVQKDLGTWSKYRKIMAIQDEKDAEVKLILDKDQFDQYESKRDELFWKAVLLVINGE